jgi:spore coat polysaccharide biosynthesis predicted glycosyltransferase SpsG
VIAPGTPTYKSSHKNQIVLNGFQYSLLAPEYSLPNISPSVDDAHCILIACGLRDSLDWSGLVLRALGRVQFDGSVILAIGSDAPHLESLKVAVSLCKFPITIVVDSDGLFLLLMKSDVVIGSGGISLLERMAVGRPSVTVVTAHNQIQQAQWAETIGATILVNGLDQSCEQKFKEVLRRLLSSKGQRQEMSTNGMKAVDGKGAERVAKYLLRERELAHGE